MITKICNKCGIEKSVEEFAKKKPKKEGWSNVYYICRKCHAESCRTYFNKNYDYHYNTMVKRRAAISKWFKEFRLTLKCEECGENHPACIDFHHKDGSKKRDNICSMVLKGFSKESIIREIQKCQILCANCHRKLHFGNNHDYRTKKEIE